MADDLSDLRDIFKVEATVFLEELAGSLAALGVLSGKRLQSLVTSCTRLAHNVKGAAAISARSDIELLAQAVERALSQYRDSEQPPPAVVQEALNDCTTVLLQLLDSAGDRDAAQAMIARLETCLEGTPGEAPASGSTAVHTMTAQTGLDDAERIGRLVAGFRELLGAGARAGLLAGSLEGLQNELVSVTQGIDDRNVRSSLTVLEDRLGQLLASARRDEHELRRAAGEMRQLREVHLERLADELHRMVPPIGSPSVSVGKSSPVPAGASRKLRPRVLMVDDSLTSRTLQASTLDDAGYEVTTIADGQSAWEALNRGEFDILISDVRMQGVDGFELTRRVRADPRLHDLPVILVSAMGSETDIDQGAKAGANAFLLKGLSEQDRLVAEVARLV